MTFRVHQADDIAWIEQGNGPAVLFLHGMPGSRTSWMPQMQSLAGTYRGIAWDMPGYGDSPLRADLVTPRMMATFLAQVMRETMDSGPTHVVGLSLGGMIALELALVAPDLVRSLCVLDCSPKFGLEGGSDADEFVASVRTPLENGTPKNDLCAAILQDLVSPDCAKAAFETALAAMQRTTPQGLVHAATLIGNHDSLDKLGEITAPMLIMVGEKDTATPLSYSQAIANRVTGARLEIVPNAGHLSNLENPEFVTAELEKFLTST